MKNLLLLIIILGFSFVIKADSWALPTTVKWCTENKKYCLKVEPKKLESQLSYFKDKVDEKENAGADKNVKENYCKGTFFENGKELWKVQLDNEVSPVSVLISNDGNYVITFDNWHAVGYGDNVVAIYHGSTGKLIRKLGLKDFLTESDIYHLPASTSSINWHGIHQIDDEKKQLILKVVKPGKDGDFFDVPIDLTEGGVLDEIVDRIPAWQFILAIKDRAEKNPNFPVNGVKNTCETQEGIAEISSVELKNKILQKEMPEYPAAARAIGVSGESVFEVFVSQNGEVECVSPMSGHPLLRAALLNSIKKWQFEKSQNKYKGKIIIEGKSVRVLNGKVIE